MRNAELNEMIIKDLVSKQKEYFYSGETREYKFRVEAMERLYKSIKKHEKDLEDALLEDLNKAPDESYMTEIGLVLEEISFCKKRLKSWMAEKKVPTPVAIQPAVSFVSPEPYGTVLIMAPWNYPVNLCLIPLVGAIAAGNCAVIKPSAYAPASSRAIRLVIEDVFSEEYVAVIEGGRAENTELLEQEFDYIFFTGSPAVGKTVMAAAAKNLTPVTLELGGKSPVIVDATADIKLAAKKIAFGKTVNAGQTCVEPDYLLIDKTVKQNFYTEYKNALAEFFPGGDMSKMGVIINEKHYRRVLSLLEGQTAVIGGGHDDARRFVEPTVLDGVDPESPVMQQEIFGPVLPVIEYTGLGEAVDFIRKRPKPLALYMFSNDESAVRHVLDSCSFGGGCINDTLVHLSTSYMPFGGVGNSGMGSYHGEKSFETFSHFRSIVKASGKFDLPVRYRPYSKAKSAMVKSFLH